MNNRSPIFEHFFHCEKALAMYILDLIFKVRHTHTNYGRSTPKRPTWVIVVSSLKEGGKIESDKAASLTQYVNHSRVSGGKPCRNSNGDKLQSALGYLPHGQSFKKSLSLQFADRSVQTARNIKVIELILVGSRMSGSQNTKKQSNSQTTQRCATVRNRRNWTIIIKYHHFVTIKGIWKYFFSPINISFCCFFRRASRYSVETVEQIRVEYKQAVFGGAGGACGGCLCYLPPTSLRVMKWMLAGQSESSGCCSTGRE